MKLLLTGGAGFIGSAVVRYFIDQSMGTIVNVDNLTYAGNLKSLTGVEDSPEYFFEQADICDTKRMTELLEHYQPDAIMHLAAESHVDRSIDGPSEFITTNVIGTCSLLEAARSYWMVLDDDRKEKFRFHHISTDEVYGSLGAEGLFSETTPYSPSSPYSASKASSDHLVNAWYHTYGLPVVTTNCSNNYGPHQFPEKLIPLMILNALEGKSLPIYGNGENVRDWLYVNDHVRALLLVLQNGKVGETYNIGGNVEKSNLEVVNSLCEILDELLPDSTYSPHASLIKFVDDRPGHDLRYAIDATKISRDLNWSPEETFDTGLRKTVSWYLDNLEWSRNVQDGSYCRERLGSIDETCD